MFARLLSYPDAALREHLPEMRDALHGEAAMTAAPTCRTRCADKYPGARRRSPARRLMWNYSTVAARPRCICSSMCMAIARSRAAMIDLAQTYEQAGLFLAPGELPDYLPAVLEFVSTQPPPKRELSWAKWRIFSVPSCRLAATSKQLCQRNWRVTGARGRDGAAGEVCPRPTAG